MLDYYWDEVINEREEIEREDDGDDSEKPEETHYTEDEWESYYAQHETEDWGEEGAESASSGSNLVDQFYREVYGNEKLEKLAAKTADETGSGSYGERDHGCSLLSRFYDEEPPVDKCWRVAGRVAK